MVRSELDLLLINPAASHGIYGELGDTLIAVEPPLWVRIIAGFVRDHGFSVKVLDAEALRTPPEHVANLVASYKPRLVAICVYGHQPSASTQQMHGAREVAKALWDEPMPDRAVKAHREIPVIMVGGHVAALPERTLREEPVDYACNGEGVITILNLLQGAPAKDIPGLVWRDVGGAIINNPRAPLPPLSELSGDAWDLLPMKLYRAHNWQAFGDLGKRQPYASIYTSLNCPYRCSFCCISAPFGNNRYLMRKPESVVAEIAELYEVYGIRTLKIVDEMFILNERHYTEIASGLLACGFEEPINIWAYARVDTVKPETLKLLRSAGFRWLALGIESGSKHVRDGTDKALRTDDVIGTVRAIQSAGINVIGNYIFGLPDDDIASMQATLDLALDCRTEFANFYSAQAYPGSRLYEEALRTGAALPESWRGYSQHNEDCRPLDTEHVSGADVLRFRDEAFTRYFTDPGYLAMVEAKFGAETLEHVRQMTTYKLRRKLLESA